jgi:hypothetical protein
MNDLAAPGDDVTVDDDGLSEDSAEGVTDLIVIG